MPETDHFDDVVERDWNRFRHRLAARISTMVPGGRLTVTADGAHGQVPCATVDAAEPATITVELLGSRPIVRPSGHTADLARRITTAVRTAHGVVHPVFVHVSDGTAAGALRDRVGEALTAQFRRPVAIDADGDFVVVVDAQAVFVVVDPTGSRVTLWVPLLHGITDAVRAAGELADLNRHWPHIKIVLVEDRLVATLDAVCEPFVPGHLASLFVALRGFLATVDARFARRFEGVRYAGDVEA
ncbi:MAG: hypothetical protein GXY65_06185 [Rhodococcus sp.]|uniref:T3SS (YopN, CesT) and YbjN peptide-binding chaperone 1 n=1 Tax=Rhodococcus TaxID=1827 RepID=UPI0016BAB7B2|nr:MULTISPECIES: hypothetical protein [Rhodococcus]NLV78923.1 hypothetical protein [Rhodococcus sp. (in: high G+C Gram-positive bacteria)]